jgi:hypothetical protein
LDIKVYTLAFRKVKGESFQNLAPGISKLPLDLNDDWGNPLANGLYYVVVDTLENRTILKLMVLR